MARQHYLPWAVYTSGGQFKVYRHIKRMSDAITRCITGKNKSRRLAIEIHPQSGKSELVSKAVPTWCLGKNPDEKIAIISHGQEFASKVGDHNREIFSHYAPQVFGLSVDRRSNSREWFRVTGHPKGGIVSVGTGGSLIGQTCHGIVFDDPYKNAEEANSPGAREKVWDYFRTVATTRITKSSWIIVIHQRFHADDLIGRLRMENYNLPEDEQWEVLSMPAIAMETEYWEDGTVFREPGEALWPEEKGLDFLNKQRRALGPYYFNCLYQQRPGQYEGTMWDPALFDSRVQVQCWPDKMEHMVLALDPTGGKEHAKSDYPAIVALGTCGDGKFYVDSVMKHGSPGQVAENLAEFAASLPIPPDGVFLEKAMFDELYRERLAEAMAKLKTFCTVYPIETGNVKKQDRIMRLDPYLAARDIRFLVSAGNTIVLRQLKNFPHPQEHDDGPDALEMAFRGLLMTSKLKAM